MHIPYNGAALRARICPVVVASAALFVTLSGHAQTYPAKPVRVIVPFAAGGGSDFIARQISAKLSENLGQQFVVDNRGGAGGMIGIEMTAKAPPDGYTLMIMSASFSATAATNKPAFDPMHTIIAIEPISSMGTRSRNSFSRICRRRARSSRMTVWPGR